MGRRDFVPPFCLSFFHMCRSCYFPTMSKLKQIEKSVAELSPEELKAFATWFEAFQADMWDRLIEADAKAGKLDRLAEQALAEVRAGRTRSL
jgi:hypothetical protein